MGSRAYQFSKAIENTPDSDGLCRSPVQPEDFYQDRTSRREFQLPLIKSLLLTHNTAIRLGFDMLKMIGDIGFTQGAVLLPALPA